MLDPLIVQPTDLGQTFKGLSKKNTVHQLLLFQPIGYCQHIFFKRAICYELLIEKRRADRESPLAGIPNVGDTLKRSNTTSRDDWDIRSIYYVPKKLSSFPLISVR
jgi:hypothetical protein